MAQHAQSCVWKMIPHFVGILCLCPDLILASPSHNGVCNVPRGCLGEHVLIQRSNRLKVERSGSSMSTLLKNVTDVVSSLHASPSIDNGLASLLSTMNSVKGLPDLEKTAAMLVRTLTDKIVKKIEANFNETQAAIVARLQDFGDLTERVRIDHKKAKHTDFEWVECVQKQKEIRKGWEDCLVLQVNKTAEKAAVCKERDSFKKNQYKPPPSLSELKCDFTAGSCDKAFEEFRQRLDNWYKEVQALIKDDQERYQNAQEQCSALDSQDNSCNAKEAEWLKSRNECTVADEARKVSMCTMGAEYQESCKSKSRYDDLVADVEGKGHLHSEVDMQKEWKSAHLLICMLNKYGSGTQMDSSVLESCSGNGGDFGSQVGVLDKKQSKYQGLTSTPNFNCGEATISFSGSTWEMPDEVTASKDYRKKDGHTYAVSVAFGTPVFEFCSVGDGHALE